MADVTGPISTLPGSSHNLPDGAMCDMHPDRKAVRRVQGETDSFGSEMNDMCQECLDEHREYIRQERETERRCDYCNQMKTHVAPFRDMDEGMCGPLYDVCSDCRQKAYKEAAEELEAMYEELGDYYDPADDHDDPEQPVVDDYSPFEDDGYIFEDYHGPDNPQAGVIPGSFCAQRARKLRKRGISVKFVAWTCGGRARYVRCWY